MDRDNVCIPDKDKAGKSSDSSGVLAIKKVNDAVFESAPNLILIIGNDFRIEKINKAGSELIGRDPASVLGMLGGDIFSCVNSVRGNGCGNTPECSRCTIRNIVLNTFKTGKDHHHIEGNMDILLPDETITGRDFFMSTVYVPS